MARIVYYGEREVIESDPAATLLETAIRNKIPHVRECGGQARCTTCRVKVLDGAHNLLPRNEAEALVADRLGWDDFTRLACQTRTQGDVVIQRLLQSSRDFDIFETLKREYAAGTEHNLAVMFCDIRNFTPFSERHWPYDVVHLLNEHFTRTGECILHNKGYIDKYIGDGVLALFGLDETDPHLICQSAIRAGMGILNANREFNRIARTAFGAELDIGVGLHYGPAIVGRIGHPHKMEFTVIGDTVNVASRIESANKAMGTRFLISETVARHLRSEVEMRHVADERLRGKSEPLALYEVLGFIRPDTILTIQTSFEKILGVQEQAMCLFYDRLFEIAPEVRSLFQGDLIAQRRMLMQMVHSVVIGLTRPENILMGLHELGRVHESYGIRLLDYDVLKEVFLWMLSQILEEEFTDEVRTAWEQTLNLVMDAMKGAY